MPNKPSKPKEYKIKHTIDGVQLEITWQETPLEETPAYKFLKRLEKEYPELNFNLPETDQDDLPE